jgi:hypothetical protein
MSSEKGNATKFVSVKPEKVLMWKKWAAKTVRMPNDAAERQPKCSRFQLHAVEVSRGALQTLSGRELLFV